MRFSGFDGEWRETTIGEAFELYSGNTPSRLDKDNFVGDVIWITSGELKEHYIGDTKEHISKSSVCDYHLRLLPVGTFVIAIYGLEADGIRGTGSITTKESTISQACMAFTPKMDISNEFLFSWYKKHGNIIGLKYAQGTKQQNISNDILEKFKIIYPDKNEQEKLTRFIELIDQRITAQIGAIEKIESLISCLYDKLFQTETGETKPLKGICQIRKGKQVNSDQLSERGEYYVMNGGITPSGYWDKFNAESGTISISEGGNSCGYVQYNEYRFWSGGHCYTLHPDNKRILTKYLFHYLKYRQQDIMALRTGSGLPNIQKKDLENYRILITSFAKQMHISEILDSFYSKLDIERRLLEQYRLQKQYLLSQMFV